MQPALYGAKLLLITALPAFQTHSIYPGVHHIPTDSHSCETLLSMKLELHSLFLSAIISYGTLGLTGSVFVCRRDLVGCRLLISQVIIMIFLSPAPGIKPSAMECEQR